MSKKHFEEEAARIVRLDLESNSLEERLVVARAYARLFATFNPKFDRARFLKACRLEGY
jgi:hypothetical protein